VSWSLYGRLSLMMLLEFAIWGAWAPVLAAYLLGKLKFSGKQTGWIYAALSLASIVSPFIGGQIADRWIATEVFLVVVNVGGGVLLLVAAWRKTFAGLFTVMLLYSLVYAPTLALTNSMMLVNLTREAKEIAAQRLEKGELKAPADADAAGKQKFIDDEAQKMVEKASGPIRVWGTIGWIIAGLILASWRRIVKQIGNYSDCLVLGGILSLVMALICIFLPHTPPPEKPSEPWAFLAAFKMLADPNFLIFVIISFVVTTELQFYYVPTAQFLEDLGVQNKNVPAVMTVAQIAEIFCMWLLLPLLLPMIGYRWALAIGVIAWPMRYVIFAVMRPLWLVISSLPFHGIGYTFFFFVGQLFVGKVAPPDIQASAQALIFGLTIGVGNFIGTQFTGVIMDYFKSEGKFRWRPIFLVPCALTVACAVAFLALFRG
jgi:MFS family permease